MAINELMRGQSSGRLVVKEVEGIGRVVFARYDGGGEDEPLKYRTCRAILASLIEDEGVEILFAAKKGIKVM